VVSQKLVGVAVHFISSTPDHHIDGASRIFAELGLLVAGLHFELLDRVYRRIQDDAADSAFGIIDAVNRIVVAAGPLPVHLYTGLTGPRPEILVVVRIPDGGGWSHAYSQIDEVHEETPIQRQFDHATVLHHVAQFRGFRVH